MLGCVLACPVWCRVCFARVLRSLVELFAYSVNRMAGLLAGPGVLVLARLVLVPGFSPSRSYGFKMRGPVSAGFGPGDLAAAGYSFSLLSGPHPTRGPCRRIGGLLIEPLSRAGTFRHFRPRLSRPG
jgi:hypothetical protein